MSSPHSGAQKVPVLLLKTKSYPTDGYEEYFRHAEDGRYEPSFVPVLEHRFAESALNNVRDCIKTGGLDTQPGRDTAKYGGIIFTSQRAVEAFARIIQDIRDENPALVHSLLPASTPLYVVGPATARGLRALGLQCPVLGEETGNGEALAHFILSHYNSFYGQAAPLNSVKPPLLFLVGDKRRDIIPLTLQSEHLPRHRRIGLEELVIYETVEMESFKEDFSATWSKNHREGKDLQWVVVFSPTGCQAMLDSLGYSGDETADGIGKTRRTKVATIGPTTRDFLQSTCGFEPDVCAPKPSAEGVGDAITAFMREKSL